MRRIAHRALKMCVLAHDHSPSLGGAQTSGSASAPPGVCRTFWTGGECRFGFNCRYKHEHASRHAPSTPLVRTQGAAAAAAETIVPLLNAGGLAKLTGRSTDIFFADTSRPLTPSEVHNYLKRYLHDNYLFRNVLDMYSFCKLINNASVHNSKWVSVILPLPACDRLINVIPVDRRWPGKQRNAGIP